MIDRFVEWCIKNILRIRDPRDDPGWKPAEPEEIPWDVPLDQTTAPITWVGGLPYV